MLETSLGEASCSNYVTNFPYPSLTSITPVLMQYIAMLYNIVYTLSSTSSIHSVGPFKAFYALLPAVLFILTYLLTYLLLTPTRHIWEALGHAEISGRRLFIHISTTVNILILIYRGPTSMSTGVRWRERKFSLFETATKGI